MLGLFGAINMGTRALQNQQLGIEVTGHNLANVSNPAYRRQRLELTTADTLPTPLGPQGLGSHAVGITQMRDALLDARIQQELSLSGYLEAQQQALEYAQSNLGQEIDRTASAAGASGTSSGQFGLAEGLSSFFNAFQSLSTNPTSPAERQVLLLKAQDLVADFNQTHARLEVIEASMNDTVRSDLNKVNELLTTIARLNDDIRNTENSTNGVANDLRDTRQATVEELSRLVDLEVTESAEGACNIAIGGVSVVEDKHVLETLETYDPGDGRLLVRAANGPGLTLSGGRLQGTIEARDGALAKLQTSIDTLAANLISEVNSLHAGGYGLDGATGRNFFAGTDAASIVLDAALQDNPAAIQASGVLGEVGDNQVALGLARLATARQAALENQSFSEYFGSTTASLGQTLASANGQAATQKVVESMLLRQRDSIVGVSLDEEMTNMMQYQRAFQASAKFINTIDELFETVLSLKR